MKFNWIVSIIIGFSTVFMIVTMNDGHPWGDDFAMYLLHANQIADGKPYSETGFIYNDLAPTYAPASYPPGFPLILAPVVHLFQYNYLAYKIYLLCFFILFLILIAIFLRGKINNQAIYCVLIIIGFSIFFMQLLDSVLSDIPGAAFFILSLILIERSFRSDNLMTWVLAGFCLGFAYLIRSTAIVIIPALFAQLVFHRFEHWKKVITITIGALLYSFVTGLILPSESNYVAMLSQTFEGRNAGELMDFFGHNFLIYVNSFRDLSIGGGYHNIFTNDVVFFGGMVFFCIGCFYQLFKERRYLEWLFICYFGMIVIWPGFQGLRYFTPLIPIYLYYAFIGIQVIFKERWTLYPSLVLVALSIISGISALVNGNSMTKQYGITGPNSIALFEAIKENTPPEALIMANKPRAICFITGRNGIVFPDFDHRGKLRDCIKDNKVEYLVLPTGGYDPPYARVDILPDSSRYSPVYQNPEWSLLKVLK